MKCPYSAILNVPQIDSLPFSAGPFTSHDRSTSPILTSQAIRKATIATCGRVDSHHLRAMEMKRK
ncbi:MAG: hypothetical protein ACKO96_49100, partial [Flammeovirgaceae bacterium]